MYSSSSGRKRKTKQDKDNGRTDSRTKTAPLFFFFINRSIRNTLILQFTQKVEKIHTQLSMSIT